jgi:hypothetical protein
VEPAQVGGERLAQLVWTNWSASSLLGLGRVDPGRGRGRGRLVPWGSRGDRWWFVQTNWRGENRAGRPADRRWAADDRGDDVPVRRGRGGPQLRRDLLRLALRAVEEARQDGGAVLGRDDLRQLDHARDAEPAVAEGLDDLGVLLDQLHRDLPEVRRALREVQLAVQEGEEAGVAQLAPRLQTIELRERDEEVGHCVVLAAKKVGESIREVACVRHCTSLARKFGTSPNATERAQARERGQGFAIAASEAARARASARRRQEAVCARPAPQKVR